MCGCCQCTQAPPSSTGVPPSSLVHVRPPSRSRASSSVVRNPAARSSRAAVTPAKPPPTTIAVRSGATPATSTAGALAAAARRDHVHRARVEDDLDLVARGESGHAGDRGWDSVSRSRRRRSRASTRSRAPWKPPRRRRAVARSPSSPGSVAERELLRPDHRLARRAAAEVARSRRARRARPGSRFASPRNRGDERVWPAARRRPPASRPARSARRT